MELPSHFYNKTWKTLKVELHMIDDTRYIIKGHHVIRFWERISLRVGSDCLNFQQASPVFEKCPRFRLECCKRIVRFVWMFCYFPTFGQGFCVTLRCIARSKTTFAVLKHSSFRRLDHSDGPRPVRYITLFRDISVLKIVNLLSSDYLLICFCQSKSRFSYWRLSPLLAVMSTKERFDHGPTSSNWSFTPCACIYNHFQFCLSVQMDPVIEKGEHLQNGVLYKRI